MHGRVAKQMHNDHIGILSNHLIDICFYNMLKFHKYFYLKNVN